MTHEQKTELEENVNAFLAALFPEHAGPGSKSRINVRLEVPFKTYSIGGHIYDEDRAAIKVRSNVEGWRTRGVKLTVHTPSSIAYDQNKLKEIVAAAEALVRADDCRRLKQQLAERMLPKLPKHMEVTSHADGSYYVNINAGFTADLGVVERVAEAVKTLNDVIDSIVQKAWHRNHGQVTIDQQCRYMQARNPAPETMFVKNAGGEILEVSKSLVKTDGPWE